MSRTERLAEPETFGKYQLIARLAHGRMGDVYKAKSHGVEGFERILVVKTIETGLAAVPGFLDAVVEEAQRAVMLSHANVAQVLNLGQEEDENRAFLATEFVNGLDLGRAMSVAAQAQTPWPFELSVFIAAEIANGLDYAHRRKDYNFNRLNLMHRDLCPYNVILSTEGDVKLTDFGIGRAMDLVPPTDDAERIRRVVYQAPEFVRQQTYTQQSDLFSLGLLLYEMLAGAHPYTYQGGGADAVEQRARQGTVPPIGQFAQLPRPLVQILESMLVPDPAGRAASAGQLYEELVGYIFGNNLARADSRALSMFVQELRKDEQRLFPEDLSQEVGLDEISLSELQVPEHAESLYGDLEQQPPHSPPADEADSLLDEPVEEATMDALPRQKIQRMIMGEGAGPARAKGPGRVGEGGGPDDSHTSPLPGALEEYFRATREGRGKAVLLYGQLGAGRDYLPDRLVDILGIRGNTMACAVQCTRDDPFRPFGAIGDAMLRALEPALGVSPLRPEDALKKLPEMGVRPEAIEVLAEVWDLNDQPLRWGAVRKRALLADACGTILTRLCQRGALVFVLDHIEHADALSMDVLRDLIGTIGSQPAMVIMSTQRVEQLRQALDTGNPEHLGAVKVLGKEPPKLREIGQLDEDAARALALLGVLEQPLEQSELARLLELPSDRLFAAMRTLVERGLVRVPRTGVFLAGLPNLSAWVEDHMGSAERRRLAAQLLRFYAHQRDSAAAQAPTRIRLHAISNARRSFLTLTDRHIDRLRRQGWRTAELALYRHAAELLTSESLGAPAERLDYMLSRAELALELALQEEARASIGPIIALSENMRNERGAVRSQLLQGQLVMQQDDLEEARYHFSLAVDAARTLQDPDLLARAMVAQAGWYERYGDNLAGQRMLEGAMNLYNRWGTWRMDMYSRALMLNRAVNLWCNRGMYTRAVHLVEDLRRLAHISGLASLDCRVEWAQARVQAARGDMDSAVEMLDAAARTAHEHGLIALHMELVRQHCAMTLDVGDFDGALRLLSRLLPMAHRHRDIYSHQRALDMRAFARCMRGERVEQGLEQLEESLARARQRRVPKDIYRCHVFLDRALRAADHPDRAAPHALRAQQLAARMRFEHRAA